MVDALNPLLGFAAGALTILSPCVLPLVPIVLGSAAQANPRGPLALAAGLVVSFTATGLVIASLGNAADFDPELFRRFGAVLLALVGVLLLMQRLQDRLALAAAPLTSWANARQSGLNRYGLAGQAAIGLLLGLVWSPCVGPTLGAATVLAAQGTNQFAVGTTMAAFALGISAVLLGVAYAARSSFSGKRTQLLAAGKTGKRVFGGMLVAVGVMILTGGDRLLEGLILEHLPSSIIDLSVQV